MGSLPAPPPAATEFVALHYLKWLIKSLALGAEQELAVFTLHWANQASHRAGDSET